MGGQQQTSSTLFDMCNSSNMSILVDILGVSTLNSIAQEENLTDWRWLERAGDFLVALQEGVRARGMYVAGSLNVCQSFCEKFSLLFSLSQNSENPNSCKC